MAALLPARSPSGSKPAPFVPGSVPEELRGGISDASRQLRALAMLSGSLTDPLTPRDAADVVERQALAVLDATSAVVVTLGEFPPNDAADSSVLLDATLVRLAVGPALLALAGQWNWWPGARARPLSAAPATDTDRRARVAPPRSHPAAVSRTESGSA